MLRSSSSWQDASGLEQREKRLAGGSRGVAMNAPSSVAWMHTEIFAWMLGFRSAFKLNLSSSLVIDRLFASIGISIDYSSFWGISIPCLTARPVSVI